jgi:hypothetical protein
MILRLNAMILRLNVMILLMNFSLAAIRVLNITVKYLTFRDVILEFFRIGDLKSYNTFDTGTEHFKTLLANSNKWAC